MEALKTKPQVEGDSNWIWVIAILVMFLLFIAGLYFLLGGNSLLNLFGGGNDDSDSDDGSWIDNLGESDDSEEEVIPAPPVLPS